MHNTHIVERYSHYREIYTTEKYIFKNTHTQNQLTKIILNTTENKTMTITNIHKFPLSKKIYARGQMNGNLAMSIKKKVCTINFTCVH